MPDQVRMVSTTDLAELRNLTILYATETGNAQDVSERLSRHVKQYHFETRVFSVDNFPLVCFISFPSSVQSTLTTLSGGNSPGDPNHIRDSNIGIW